MRRSTDAWRELALALELEEPAELVKTAARLGPALGLDVDLDGDAVAGLALARRLEQVLSEERARRRQHQLAGRLSRALAAAEAMGRIPLDDGKVALELSQLDALSMHPAVRLLGFALRDAEPLLVDRARLRAACRLLRRFGDVTVYLDERALHFRWRGGRGGLDLRYGLPLTRKDERRIFVIRLGGIPPIAPALVETRRSHPRAAWLGELFDELALLF